MVAKKLCLALLTVACYAIPAHAGTINGPQNHIPTINLLEYDRAYFDIRRERAQRMIDNKETHFKRGAVLMALSTLTYMLRNKVVSEDAQTLDTIWTMSMLTEGFLGAVELIKPLLAHLDLVSIEEEIALINKQIERLKASS